MRQVSRLACTDFGGDRYLSPVPSFAVNTVTVKTVTAFDSLPIAAISIAHLLQPLCPSALVPDGQSVCRAGVQARLQNPPCQWASDTLRPSQRGEGLIMIL